jgi:integrase
MYHVNLFGTFAEKISIMANVNFYLLSTLRGKSRLIFLRIVNNGKHIKYYTPYKVHPDHWNSKKQRIKSVIAVKGKDVINRALDRLEEKALEVVNQAIAEGVPLTSEYLKTRLDMFTNRIGTPYHFFDFINEFIETSITRTDARTGRNISPETIRKYKYVRDVLQSFQKGYRTKIDFDTINYAFFTAFVKWMIQTKEYSANNIDKIIECLRTFLNAATVKGINKRMDYKEDFFHVPTEKSEAVYLSDSELMQIHNADFSHSERLERARDLFLVGACTGLRFSDFTSIKAEHIKENKIELHQYKTGDKVVIPIAPMLRAILDKYNGSTPPALSNQRLNMYIKEVCKLAGITEPIEKQMTKGGMRYKTVVEKCELVSTHTARRSFASNLYRNGAPARSIMKLTGHKTEKAFLSYICLSDDEHADIIANYFAKNLKAV